MLTEKAALERAFPGAALERRTLYLSVEQVAAVEKAARSKLPSAVVTVFGARAEGEDEGAPFSTRIWSAPCRKPC